MDTAENKDLWHNRCCDWLGRLSEGDEDMFCSRCGQELSSKGNCCPRCVEKAPYGQPAEKNQAPETVAWVMSGQYKRSVFKRTPCYVVFFKERVLFAYLSRGLQKAESAKVSREIKAKGLGFFKGSAEMMSYWANYSTKYHSMSCEEILKEDPSNIAIANRDIVRVLYSCYSETYSAGDSTPSFRQGKLQFTMQSGAKHKFTHSHQADKSVRGVLDGLFGERLKYKR